MVMVALGFLKLEKMIKQRNYRADRVKYSKLMGYTLFTNEDPKKKSDFILIWGC